MNPYPRLTVFILLASFFLLTSSASLAQGGKLNNEFFQLKINQPGWLPMSKTSLLDKSDYASASSGRTIKYLDGLSNVKKLIPYIIFQQADADLGATNIKAYLRDMASSASLPTHLHEISSAMPIPKNYAEMHFNLYDEYALMTNEVEYENEPCVNFSYMLPHGKGLMYMHCYCHVMDAELYYPQFEQIRKDLKFIFPTSSAPKPQINNSETESQPINDVVAPVSGSNLPKFIFMGIAVLLLLFILAKASKPK